MVSREDEKAKIKIKNMSHNPSTHSGSDGTGGKEGMLDEMRGCEEWVRLMSLFVPLLPTSIRLLLLHLLFFFFVVAITRGHT